MDTNLLKARMLSFAFNLGSALVYVVVGYFVSPDFQALVTHDFGAFAGGIVALIIPEIAKHIRNVRVLNAAADDLGSIDEARKNVVLI